MESVETSVGNEDRGRRHVCAEWQIPHATRSMESRNLGDGAAKPAGDQTPERLPTAVGEGAKDLSSLRSIIPASRSDPPAPGTSCGRASGAGTHVLGTAH